MNKIYIAASALALTFVFAACSKSDDPSDNGGNTGGGTGGGSGEVTQVIPITSTLSVNLSTDKACYNPGSLVQFTIDYLPSTQTTVRYRTGSTVVGEEPLSQKTWTWTAPATDFTGYMVDLYQKLSDGSELIVGTIGVDVSSNWARFPRYGFVAAFGNDKTSSVIADEMAQLNRYHINGVQFQDWHYKHHWPLGGTRAELLAQYKDIANRTNYTSVIKNYISSQHSYGMKSMFYNLCYGALDDAMQDGVKPEWYVFKDASRGSKDSHNLPSSWKSDIYVLNPANTEWQAYLAQRNDDVYANLDFDGFQIDQLGNRGNLYDYSGTAVNMPKGFASFITAMKSAHPNKQLVMNAVSSYGSQQICQSGGVDFCYNELWGDEDKFTNLHAVIKANNVYSGDKLNTVFAAYMNYDLADKTGNFNTAGVLLTDAVMFALGGSHLELGGDHMLGKEYFPNNNLKIPGALKTSLIRYYDFLVAYENLLRDGGKENEPTISCTSAQKITAWEPKLGYITTYSKTVGSKQIVHLLNFVKANSLSWRDLNGTMPAPSSVTSIGLKISYSTQAKKVWVASPDQHGGVPQELAFKQENGTITVTVPSLKYWTMLVIE